MTQTIISVIAFLALLAMLPFGVRWIQRRTPGGVSATSASKIVSAIAVGPHQRVVTVEVGPEGARTWLVLGVTAQAITCLHSVAVKPGQDQDAGVAAPAIAANS
jgi:flagellar protein FliO/FliZ